MTFISVPFSMALTKGRPSESQLRRPGTPRDLFGGVTSLSTSQEIFGSGNEPGSRPNIRGPGSGNGARRGHPDAPGAVADHPQIAVDQRLVDLVPAVAA